MSKISLSNRHIAEVLSPEQRKKAQEILNKETGADKSQEEAKARKERSEIRKEKELELKQANLEIRKKREARRDEGREERKADKAAREKADALKDKQKGLTADIKQKRTEAGAAKQKAVAATKKSYETITDKDGDGTALGKMGGNIAKSAGAVAGSVANRIKAFRKNRQADKTQKELDKTKTEQFLYEVETVEKKEKMDKIIDIMKGKNKIEVNPTVKAEGVISQVKKGVERHKDAVEKKKIKNRKAVPYAALAAETQPEGEMVEDYYSGTGEKVQKRTLAWMRKKGMKGSPGLNAMKAREAEHKAKRGVKEDWKPEIEHSKLGDAKKKADKKRESKLPPHLQGDAIGKMKKAFSQEGYRVLASSDGQEKPSQFSYKDEKTAKKYVDSIKKGGGKATVVKEDIGSFKEYMANVDAAKKRQKDKQENRKKKSDAYIDRVRKGIKFYDAKGSGRMVKGKKVYDKK